MPFKDISYLELWQPFCSAEQNHLCNFGRGYYEEQFCEIILNLGQSFRRRCCLKDLLSGALAALLLGGAEPGLASDLQLSFSIHNSTLGIHLRPDKYCEPRAFNNSVEK